uniref:Serine/threonine-protein kinase PLK n=1 Tax=Ciona savignyi TaxID=51511 RepID=H2Y8V6_CIOSA
RYIHNTSDGSVYHKRRLLGKGGFARVYEVEQQSFNEETIGMVCAAKVIDKSRLSRPQQREKVEIEIKLLKAARGHPNVVSFHSSFENENVICILLELCNKKSLAQYLRRKQQLCEAEVAAITRQVVSGLAHLHGKGILHRDLKLGNILLTDDMTAKIGDFGLATLVEWGKKKTICGTPNFIAPEVLQRLGHGPEADVWALGCLLYTLLVGKPPFETACLRETYRCILKNSFRIPTTVSAEAADLLRWMLRHKPKTRPTLSEVSSHAFFTKHQVDATPVPPHPSCTSCTTEPTSRPDAQQSPEHDVQPHPVYPTDNPSTDNTKQTDKTPTNNELDTTSNISLHDSKSPMRQFAHKIQRRFRVLSPRKCVRAAATTLFDSRKDSERQSNDTDIKPIRKSSATVNMAYQQPQRLANGFAPTWVCKWVDYSNRYGFGYQLANGRICVLFNDGKHIAMLPGGKLIEYASNEQCNAIRFPADSVPLCLERYATMLKSFTNYMDSKLRLNPPLQVNESSSSRLLTWHRTDEFVLMYLNDGTLQVNFCADHCKI